MSSDAFNQLKIIKLKSCQNSSSNETISSFNAFSFMISIGLTSFEHGYQHDKTTDKKYLLLKRKLNSPQLKLHSNPMKIH